MNGKVMDKEKWVSLFRAIGLDEATMSEWHRLFEERHPEGHLSFPEWQQIPADEIQSIRAWSKRP